MRPLTLPIASLALILGAPHDGEELPTSKGGAPELCLPSAAASGAPMTVRLAAMAGEVVDGKEVYIPRNHWVASGEFVLGDRARAYRSDGRAAGPGEVLKALSRPTGVACFIGFVGQEPTPPDPFYLALL